MALKDAHFVDAEYQFSVMAHTWGLPEVQKRFNGQCLYVNGEVVHYDFGELDGLWLCMHDFFDYFSKKVDCNGIFLFDGWYQKFKNGNFRMEGKISEIQLTDLINIGRKIPYSEHQDISKARRKKLRAINLN